MSVDRMRALIALSVIGFVLIVSLLLLPPAPPPAADSTGSVPRIPVSGIKPPHPAIVMHAIANEAEPLNDPETTAVEDLRIVGFVISCYRRHHGGNPTGENENITAALMGANPRNLAYLPCHGKFLDPQGRLIDRWGTPYFFHALARDRMEIRSAGPDREFWSTDDLVHHPGS